VSAVRCAPPSPHEATRRAPIAGTAPCSPRQQQRSVPPPTTSLPPIQREPSRHHYCLLPCRASTKIRKHIERQPMLMPLRQRYADADDAFIQQSPARSLALLSEGFELICFSMLPDVRRRCSFSFVRRRHVCKSKCPPPAYLRYSMNAIFSPSLLPASFFRRLFLFDDFRHAIFSSMLPHLMLIYAPRRASRRCAQNVKKRIFFPSLMRAAAPRLFFTPIPRQSCGAPWRQRHTVHAIRLPPSSSPPAMSLLQIQFALNAAIRHTTFTTLAPPSYTPLCRSFVITAEPFSRLKAAAATVHTLSPCFISARF